MTADLEKPMTHRQLSAGDVLDRLNAVGFQSSLLFRGRLWVVRLIGLQYDVETIISSHYRFRSYSAAAKYAHHLGVRQ